jgi:hypothetical protein
VNSIHLSLLQIVTLVVSVVLPLVTALVTGQKTHAGVKAVIFIVLSALTGFGSTWLAALHTNKPFDLVGALVTAGVALFIGINAHFGIWKPTTLAAALQNVGPTLFASSADGSPAITAVANTAPLAVSDTTTFADVGTTGAQ